MTQQRRAIDNNKTSTYPPARHGDTAGHIDYLQPSTRLRITHACESRCDARIAIPSEIETSTMAIDQSTQASHACSRSAHCCASLALSLRPSHYKNDFWRQRTWGVRRQYISAVERGHHGFCRPGLKNLSSSWSAIHEPDNVTADTAPTSAALQGH